MATPEYENLRRSYKPVQIEWLFIAESPPPEADTISTRHFYRSGVGEGDRLFSNTIKALYPQASTLTAAELANSKPQWLKRLQADRCYMIEALDESQPHKATSSERQQKLKDHLPQLIHKVQELADQNTKIILIKSNPFKIATEPLRQAGFNVLNQALLDYPGYWREEPYRTKLKAIVSAHGWKPQSN